MAFLAAGAGLSVATLYYSQPLLGDLRGQIAATSQEAGLIPTLTQAGYAAGIFFLAPLGDRFDRRRIILCKAALLCLALLMCAASPGIGVLLLSSFVIGLVATLAQDIVPAAAALAPDERRGRTVGNVMTGLLLGILLSRVFSGIVAGLLGWRAVFALAAVSIAAFLALAWFRLPAFAPTTTAPYPRLLLSLAQLWRRYPALRQAALAQGVLAVGFSAFWSNLAVMLHDDMHLGSAAAGAFGLAGAAGALAAPFAGRVADRRGPGLVTRLGASVVALSFAAIAIGSLLLPHGSLLLLVIGTIVFDFGFQATLVAHQTIVYSLDPAARSRLNAVLFVAMFLGMAAGSAGGGFVYARSGWAAVAGLCTLSALGALAIRMSSSSSQKDSPSTART